MNIKIVRLTSGEEILCDLEIDESNDGTYYNLTNPVVLIPTQGKNLALIPWLAYAELEDDTIALLERHVMFVVGAHEELEKEYKTQVNNTPQIIEPSNKVMTPDDILGAIGPAGGR